MEAMNISNEAISLYVGNIPELYLNPFLAIFYIPWKQKTYGFLMLLGGIERQPWVEIG